MVCGVIRDITQRERMEKTIRNKRRRLGQLLEMHERDRKLVAFEIHDGFVQPLAGALMNFEGSLRVLQEQYPGAAWEGCHKALQLLRDSINEARRLMGGLRPAILDQFGIVAAIDNLVHEARKGGGPEIEFVHNVAFDRLASPLETAIFRIVQESVNNARQHSNSDRVRIGLKLQDNHVHVEVQDWGVGFDPATVEKTRFGLEGIRERANLLGGGATINAVPGRGTRIVVDLPLVEAPPAD